MHCAPKKEDEVASGFYFMEGRNRRWVVTERQEKIIDWS
jgi:hypothetical protein